MDIFASHDNSAG